MAHTPQPGGRGVDLYIHLKHLKGREINVVAWFL